MDDTSASGHSSNAEEQPQHKPQLQPRQRESKPRPRPESTMALDFSEALDGAFNLGGELSLLTDSVEQKKLAVTSQSQQLQDLEARLKAAEERLKKVSGTTTPQADVGDQEPAFPVPKQAPQTAATAEPPRRAAPTRADALAASSVADRVPTPMDPSHKSKPLPGVPRASAGLRSDT